MRQKRPQVPDAEQKRAAVEYFREWDPAAESTTESESEAERLARYPAKRRPSPRKNAEHVRERLRKVGSSGGGKGALKAEMEVEDRILGIRSRKLVYDDGDETTTLSPMPTHFPKAQEYQTDDDKPGSGQVFLDHEAGGRARNTAVQARLVVEAETEEVAAPSGRPSSDMGPFAMLPGELRNRCYRFALVEGDGKPFRVEMEKKTCNRGECVHMRASTALPGILSTCKQMRAEAMPIFTVENSFKFDGELVKARCVANWLRTIGPYGNLLSKVLLEVVVWEAPHGEREKIGIPYELVLRWKSMPHGPRWSLRFDSAVQDKVPNECKLLHQHIVALSREMRKKRKAKEEVLREFVWSDWLANLVYLCRK